MVHSPLSLFCMYMYLAVLGHYLCVVWLGCFTEVVKFLRQSLPVCCLTGILYRTRHRLWGGPFLCVVWLEHYTELDFFGKTVPICALVDRDVTQKYLDKVVRQSLPVSVCCMTWMLYRTRHRLWDGPYLCVVWREHYTELDFLQSFLLLELFCGHGHNCSFLRSYDAENMKNYFEKRYIFMLKHSVQLFLQEAYHKLIIIKWLWWPYFTC